MKNSNTLFSICIALFLILGINSIGWSQNNEKVSESINLSVFYGSPFAEIYNRKYFEMLENPGLLGIAVEFVSDGVLSFEMQISYAQTHLISKNPINSYVLVDSVFQSNITYPEYNYALIRYLPLVAIHVYKTNKLDISLKTGLGSYFLIGDNILQDIHLIYGSNNYPSFGIGGALKRLLFKELDRRGIPNTSRLAIDGKYFFRDNIALNLGIGIGSGYLIRTGLSIKL